MTKRRRDAIRAGLGLAAALAGCSSGSSDPSTDAETTSPRSESGTSRPTDTETESPPGTDSPTQTPPMPTDRGAWPSYAANAANTGHVSHSLPQSAPESVWTYPLRDTGAGCLAVADGYAYAGSNTQDALVRLNGADGRESWRFEFDGPITSTPAVHEGLVYLGSQDATFRAIDAETGQERWRVETADGVVAGPTVRDGSVYVSDGGGTVAAFSLGGERQWTTETDVEAYTAPAVAEGTLLTRGSTGVVDGGVVALEADTGERRWTTETTPFSGSPVVSGGLVFVAAGQYGEGSLVAYSLAEGVEQWRVAADDVVYGTPAIHEGTVYVTDVTGTVTAVDVTDGARRWRASVAEEFEAGPVLADGSLLTLSTNGRLTALSPDDGSEAWHVSLPGYSPVPPAVVDGRIYVRERETVIRALE